MGEIKLYLNLVQGKTPLMGEVELHPDWAAPIFAPQYNFFLWEPGPLRSPA